MVYSRGEEGYNMRKLLQLALCIGVLCSVSACGKEEPKKESIKQESVEHEEKTKTVQGMVVDATNSSFTITAEDGKSYDFVRGDMKLTGEALLLNESVKVQYIVKDGKNIAKSAEVIETNTVVKQGIEDFIANMTIEEKVGQMFFVRCPNEQEVQDVANYHLGGYILFDKDFNGRSFQQVVDQITSYQAQARIPLLIGVDEEGGSVVRASRYTTFRGVPFWSPQDLYNYGGFDLIRSDAKEKASLLTSIGINVNLAPVADVSTNPNDFIYARSFGKDAMQTAQYVETVVSEMKLNSIGTTLKHFPGYGNNIDTHTGIAIDERSFESFEDNDFQPFIAGMKAGADSILVSHNIIKRMDGEHPASLSKKVHDVLRDELGFQGVIMTDDLAMGAILQYSDDTSAAVSAVKAGNDLLICTNYREQLPAVIQAVKNGELSEAQLDASLMRILKWKIDLGILAL